ncbi:MAG: chromosome segregation protein SMC [Burkholderiales bacterium]
MRLTHINLAGFKSFVEPTPIPVPGQLVGIVGPNGCGKSNIIDAVRWVLGETSARHLRGETMQDVLFNGSGDRKPVNRASVELIFDNSLGKAAGQWSSYGEISVKRVIERDGDSTYYINNLPVRRRDVTDIFLGTGLGARAYAIIEQGMISRVIEAKPEDLRVFLEEAAGVSKYRERRRETELRLRDTRENLLRVEDIRQELTKQLEHLQAQAEVAGKYHELQGELNTLQGLLWFTRRKEAAAARNRHAKEIERTGIELEAETAKLREAESRLETLRAEHYKSGDALHACQGSLYEANAEVARLEQQIAHIRENRSRIEHHIATLRSQLDGNQTQLLDAQRGMDESRAEQLHADESVVVAGAEVNAQGQKLPLAEAAHRTLYQQREALQHSLAQTRQRLQVEQTKIGHAVRLLEQFAQRQVRLTEERNALPAPDVAALAQLNERVQQCEAQLSQRRTQLEVKEGELPGLEQAARDRQTELDAATQKLAAIEARIHVLSQLQAKLARGANVNDMEGWQARRNLDKAPRLWQGIEIAAGWEDALEAVLRERLNGIALEQVDSVADWLSQPPPGKMTVIDLRGNGASLPDAGGMGLEPLTRYVTCRDHRLQAVVNEWLHGVYTVSDTATGMARRADLAPGGVLVSVNGYVFTRHSVTFHAPDSELHGVLSRQREIEKLESDLQYERAALDRFKSAVTAADQAIERCRDEAMDLRAGVNTLQQQFHDAQMESLRLSEQSQRATQRGEQIAAEIAEIAALATVEAAQRTSADVAFQQLQTESVELALRVERSAEDYHGAESALNAQRQALEQARQAHQEALYVQKTILNKIKETDNSIQRLSTSISATESSISEAEQDLSGFDEAPWQTQLQAMLETRVTREQALAQARDALEGMDTQLRTVEQERLSVEQKLEPLRERIAEVRLKEQEARLTEEQYAQQLAEAGANEEELAALLEKGTRSNALQSEINRINEEIRALGAVNLAALEELKTAQERRDYLDAQSRDLTEAMTTLEDAIKRIDRETRDRLQTTFDEVNRHFSEMFPALFGGGQAKLTLTGEEILDCGVHVMAQPPGKKNSTIHLLSGGEKALTALSLVFAIFQLNPAPFCLLDEVDAPLDDHNTERFCELVKKMSAGSQFLFISHNKITMEIANQLLGITMQEPGVSRVVAVDIEEAMKLSEAA